MYVIYFRPPADKCHLKNASHSCHVNNKYIDFLYDFYTWNKSPQNLLV